jgi:hypothetical protein
MARPTKLTPETQKKITDAIRLGATYKLASQYAAISYDAFNEWMAKGEQAQSGAYCQFRHAVKEAEGAAAVGWLAKIEKAASDGTWQAAAWKLERLHAEDYGRSVTTIQGDKDRPLEMNAHVTDNGLVGELAALLNTLGARAARLSDGGSPLPLDDQGATESTPAAG